MKISNLTEVCTKLPLQWECTTDNNRSAYIKYDGVNLIVRVGAPSSFSASRGLMIYKAPLMVSEQNEHRRWEQVMNTVKKIDVEREVARRTIG